MKVGNYELKKYKEVIHKDYAENADFIEASIKYLNLDKNALIVDIGTGNGAMAILLALNGFTVLTGKPEEESEHHHHTNHHLAHHKDHVGNKYAGSGSDWRTAVKAVSVEDKITFQHFNAENLPFPDKSFDGIFLYDTLQHIQLKEHALKECLRVIKPDGVICVVEWTKKAIEEDYRKFKWAPDFVDPRDYISRDDASKEHLLPNFLEIFKAQLLTPPLCLK